MCTLAIYYHPLPGLPVVVAANGGPGSSSSPSPGAVGGGTSAPDEARLDSVIEHLLLELAQPPGLLHLHVEFLRRSLVSSPSSKSRAPTFWGACE